MKKTKHDVNHETAPIQTNHMTNMWPVSVNYDKWGNKLYFKQENECL